MIRRYLGCLVGAVIVFLTGAAYAYASHSTVATPVFVPEVELDLQAAISRTAVSADPTLNRRLDEVHIRTALQDTARLRNELG